MVVIWRLTLTIHTSQGSISHGSYICNSDSMVVSFCNYQQGYEMITTNRCLCHNICAVVVWARICNVIVPNNGIAMNPDPKNIRLKEYLIIFRRLIHKFDSNLWCSAFAHRMPQDQSHRMWSVREITNSSSTFSATNISSIIAWLFQLYNTIHLKKKYISQL